MPEIGRFFGSDPIAEEFFSITNYQFAHNTPIWKVELEGLEGMATTPGVFDPLSDEWVGPPPLVSDSYDVEPSGGGATSADVGAVDNTSALDGWNRSVGKFNKNFNDLMHNTVSDPIGTAGDITIGTLNTIGQLVNDAIPGMSELSGAPNVTGQVAVDVIETVSDIPNMTNEELGSTAGTAVTAGITMLMTRKVPGGKGPSIKNQALSIKKNLNNGRNSVNVGTVNGVTHYDLDGAPHRGVETPHVQHSYRNTNNSGETFMNKDRQNVSPMTQQDIRTVRKVLEKRKQANNGG